MKLASLALVTAAALTCTIASNDAGAADRRDFWVLNQTGRVISEVHLAVHNERSSPWSDDILTDADLPNGTGAKIFFFRKGPCMMDFRIVYADGGSEDYTQGRNLCSASAVVFSGGVNDALFLPGAI